MSPEAGWLLVDQIVPRLRAVIPRSVLTVGSEDHEELVQDATCMAVRIMDNGERKGKRSSKCSLLPNLPLQVRPQSSWPSPASMFTW